MLSSVSELISRAEITLNLTLCSFFGRGRITSARDKNKTFAYRYQYHICRTRREAADYYARIALAPGSIHHLLSIRPELLTSGRFVSRRLKESKQTTFERTAEEQETVEYLKENQQLH